MNKSDDDDDDDDDDDGDEDRPITFVGSYVGKNRRTKTLSQEQLPVAIQLKMEAFIATTGRAKLRYQNLQCYCARLRLAGKTSFKWSDDYLEATCQTCANMRELCLRWDPPNFLLTVVALPGELREGLRPSDEGFWVREGDEKWSPTQMWKSRQL